MAANATANIDNVAHKETESENFNFLLMEKVWQSPSIYHKSSRDYKEQRIKRNACIEIASALSVNMDDAKQKYNNNRTRFGKVKSGF